MSLNKNDHFVLGVLKITPKNENTTVFIRLCYCSSRPYLSLSMFFLGWDITNAHSNRCPCKFYWIPSGYFVMSFVTLLYMLLSHPQHHGNGVGDRSSIIFLQRWFVSSCWLSWQHAAAVFISCKLNVMLTHAFTVTIATKSGFQLANIRLCCQQCR